ncbi:hypothetical protein MASR1M8_24890 [Thermomonas brevis]
MRTPRAQGGFILVLVLAMLVILSILAGTIASVAQRLRDQEEARKRLEDAQLEFENTRATALYLLLTQRMTIGGLTVDNQVVQTEDERLMQAPGEPAISNTPVGNEIALDGRAYAGLGGVAFSLQDDRGLLGVNWVLPELLDRWIGQWRQPGDETPAVTLRNLLLDYQDPDDLYRLNSAERDGYVQAGLRPPSNQTLATPLELRAVKGWQALLAGQGDGALLAQVTLVRSPVINVNTAPAAVLRAVPGVDADAAQRIVDARRITPFLSDATFYRFIGREDADANHVTIYPANSGVMRLWVPGAGVVRSIHWTLTPWDDGGRPWREDYELTLPQDDSTNPPTLARPAAALFARTLPADARAAGPP